MELTTLGIDLAKNVFQLHGVDERGRAVLKKRVSRAQLLETLAQLPPCTVVMESCRGSNHWARVAERCGHKARLIAPQFVKPFVKTNKNDANDSEAICEAASRPAMRFIPVKRIEQQDIQSLHRVREQIVATQVAVVNQIRALFEEYGYVLPQGISILRRGFMERFEQAREGLSPMAAEMLLERYAEFQRLEEQNKHYTKKLSELSKQHPVCQRLSTIPGVGPLTATALVSAVTDVSAFRNGRQFAAWVGLVPRQNSSGGKTRLLGINKRGNPYLRKLLIHGARATLRFAAGKTDQLSLWVTRLKQAKGTNKAAVALANKNARIVWALLAHETEFRPVLAA